MKRKVIPTLVVCAMLLCMLTLSGCKLSQYTLRANPWDQEGTTLYVYYRVTNLGDVTMIGHTICFNVTTDMRTFSFSNTETATLEGGQSGVGEASCTLNSGETVQNVTIGSFSPVYE